MIRRLLLLLILLGVAGGVGAGVRWWFAKEQPMARVDAFLAAKDPVSAEMLLRNLIRSEPRNVDAHLKLARTELLTEEWVAAEKETKVLRALRHDRLVVNPMLAQAYLMQGNYQDVLTDIPAAADRPEEVVVNQVLRSRAYQGLKDPVQARASLEAAARIAPEDAGVLLQRARLALADGDVGGAEQAVDGALRVAPDRLGALLLKADSLARKPDLAGAKAMLDRAADLAPSSPTVLLPRARVLMAQGADDPARDDVNTVLAVAPHNDEAAYLTVVLMYRAKQYADAGVEFDRLGTDILERFPQSYFFKARISLLDGHKRSALESLDHYLKLVPGDLEGVQLAGQTALDIQEPGKAITRLAATTGPLSKDALSFDLLGRAYFMLGQRAEAIRAFQAARRLAPEDKEMAAHLAAAQTEFGGGRAPEVAAEGAVR